MVLYSDSIMEIVVMSRSRYLFNNNSGAIISALDDDISPWHCLERQRQLLKILSYKSRCLIGNSNTNVLLHTIYPVIGKWESIPHPAIFAVGIKRREAQRIARSFNQDAYIFVSRGKWWGLGVDTGRVLEGGVSFPIEGLDFVLREYLRLRKMRRDVVNIGRIIERTVGTLERAILEGHSRERIMHLMKTIEGYERKRDDIINRADRLEKRMKGRLAE